MCLSNGLSYLCQCVFRCASRFSLFCLNDTATTEIYTYWHTLSLHDALPISLVLVLINRADEFVIHLDLGGVLAAAFFDANALRSEKLIDRKSTRLNSSH